MNNADPTPNTTGLHTTLEMALAALQMAQPTPPASFGAEATAQAKAQHTAAIHAVRAAMASTAHHSAALGLVQLEALAAMARWQSAIEGLQNSLAPVMEALDASPESPVSQALDRMEMAITAATAQLIGCSTEELQWHWLENNFGRRGLCCTAYGLNVAVTSHSHFLFTIGFGGPAMTQQMATEAKAAAA